MYLIEKAIPEHAMDLHFWLNPTGEYARKGINPTSSPRPIGAYDIFFLTST